MTNVSETQEVVIEITQDLAAMGVRWACMSCPVALAINALLRPRYFSAVCNDCAWIAQDVDHAFIPLPAVCREFIERFDKHLAVDLPLTFPIPIPKQFLKELSTE